MYPLAMKLFAFAVFVMAKFGVMSVPTVLIVRDGAVRDQLVGLLSKQALADRVDKVL